MSYEYVVSIITVVLVVRQCVHCVACNDVLVVGLLYRYRF